MSTRPHTRPHWTPDQAHTFYATQDWLIGSKYINAGAIIQLEML